MLFAVLTIPLLVSRLGEDRFGLLTISWLVVGYLSLFDFGLGRAMTRQVALRIGQGQRAQVPNVFWTAISSMLVFGMAGGVLAAVSAPTLATRVLAIPKDIQHEAQVALLVLSLGIPVTVISAGFLGFLEACLEFRLSGTVRFLNGLVTFLIPAAVCLVTQDISYIVIALVLSRLAVSVLSLGLCFHIMPELHKGSSFSPAEFREMLSAGGWMTISNIVSPIMSSLDRLLIGMLLTVGAVTYYSTPADAITKVLIIPVAATAVLFPTFSASVDSRSSDAIDLLGRAWEAIFFTLFPIVLAAALLAETALHVWLGETFASKSTPVVQWIAVGVLANGLASLPFSFIQAAGKSRTVALIHLVELPVYLVGLMVLVDEFGITGAAIAWTARVCVDLIALVFVASRMEALKNNVVISSWKLQSVLVSAMVLGCVLPLKPYQGVVVLTLGSVISLAMLIVVSDKLSPLNTCYPRVMTKLTSSRHCE